MTKRTPRKRLRPRQIISPRKHAAPTAPAEPPKLLMLFTHAECGQVIAALPEDIDSDVLRAVGQAEDQLWSFVSFHLEREKLTATADGKESL